MTNGYQQCWRGSDLPRNQWRLSPRYGYGARFSQRFCYAAVNIFDSQIELGSLPCGLSFPLGFRESTLQIIGNVCALSCNVHRRVGGRFFADPTVQFIGYGIHVPSAPVNGHSWLLPSQCCRYEHWMHVVAQKRRLTRHSGCAL